MNEVLVLVILIALAILTVLVPVIWICYNFSDAPTPMWLIYLCLLTIVLFFVDYVIRKEWSFDWGIPMQFIMLSFMVFDRFDYLRKEAKKKETSDERDQES